MPIFCADNRKLVVLYQGINECKSIRSESVLKTDFPSIYQKERQNLKEFLGKENNFLSSKQKNKEFLNISDISFTDDLKSEEFFNDLMKCSQTAPKDAKELRLSPKLNFNNSSNKIDKNDNILENIMFLSQKANDKSGQKSQNKRPINSPKLKIVNFKKKSPPTLKSDQLYNKKYVRRNDKLIESENKHQFNKNCEHFMQTSDERIKSNSIKTLSKFHKTSTEKLLTQNEIHTKVAIPEFFNFK